MKNKKIGGGLTIYYGFSCLLGGLAGIIGIIAWLYKAWVGEVVFSWGALAGLVFISALLVLLGYIILRVGYEQMED